MTYEEEDNSIRTTADIPEEEYRALLREEQTVEERARLIEEENARLAAQLAHLKANPVPEPPRKPRTPGIDPITGHFQKGNKLGTHQAVARANHFRNVLQKCTTDEDLKEVWAMVLKKAKGGDLEAAKVVLDRTIGRVQPTIEGDADSLGPITITFNRMETQQNAYIAQLPADLPPPTKNASS